MCGRFCTDSSIFEQIEKIAKNSDGSYKSLSGGDIYPSQDAAVIAEENREIVCCIMRWGFPNYSRKGLIINARAETVFEKEAFHDSITERRCVIPASSFYEWDTQKNKYSFSRHDSTPVYMAGFYSIFEDVRCFVILTTAANDSVRNIHTRMPVILGEKEISKWIHDPVYTKQVLDRVPDGLDTRCDSDQLKI